MSGITTSKNTEIKESMGVNFSVTGSVSNSDQNAIGQKIGANLELNWSTEYTESTTEVILEQTTSSVEWNKTRTGNQRFFIYQLVEKYELYRLNGTVPVLDWILPVAGRKNPILTYPNSVMDQGSTLKSTEGLITSYTQREAINLVPRMYSNTSPHGVASSSSSYSSIYYPWKAFDGEDESGSWSRWISIPTGTFNGQWLSYEFPEPVTIMAYNITPETGTHISRSPRNWKIEAWDGNNWITLDTRTGYTISSWQNSYSQDFNVKYPMKFKKFRLNVGSVNGSDVVSIRKFKMFGLQNDGTPKSGTMTNFSNSELTKHKPVFDMIISPNPNNGEFNVELINITETPEPILLDSLKIVEELIKGFSFEEITFPPIALIQIFDPMGKLVYNLNTNKKSFYVRIDDMRNGIYVIKAILHNQNVVTKKIIIK